MTLGCLSFAKGAVVPANFIRVIIEIDYRFPASPPHRPHPLGRALHMVAVDRSQTHHRPIQKTRSQRCLPCSARRLDRTTRRQSPQGRI